MKLCHKKTDKDMKDFFSKIKIQKLFPKQKNLSHFIGIFC